MHELIRKEVIFMGKKLMGLLFILFLAGCSSEGDPLGVMSDERGQRLAVAIEAMVGNDVESSQNLEFIAIDYVHFNELSREDTAYVYRYLGEKYKTDIRFATMDELKEDGTVNFETGEMNGVMLVIQNESSDEKKSVYEGFVQQNSLRLAAGLRVAVHLNENKWKARDVEVLWVG